MALCQRYPQRVVEHELEEGREVSEQMIVNRPYPFSTPVLSSLEEGQSPFRSRVRWVPFPTCVIVSHGVGKSPTDPDVTHLLYLFVQ